MFAKITKACLHYLNTFVRLLVCSRVSHIVYYVSELRSYHPFRRILSLSHNKIILVNRHICTPMESTETTTVKFCIEPKISQNVRVYQRLFLPS